MTVEQWVLIAGPLVTFLVGLVFNWLRSGVVSDKVMIGVIVPLIGALFAGLETWLVGTELPFFTTVLLNLAAVFLHQLYNKFKEGDTMRTTLCLALAALLVFSGCSVFQGGAKVPCEYAMTVCDAATALCSVLNSPTSSPEQIQKAVDEYNRQSALILTQAATLKLMRAKGQ